MAKRKAVRSKRRRPPKGVIPPGLKRYMDAKKKRAAAKAVPAKKTRRRRRVAVRGQIATTLRARAARRPRRNPLGSWVVEAHKGRKVFYLTIDKKFSDNRSRARTFTSADDAHLVAGALAHRAPRGVTIQAGRLGVASEVSRAAALFQGFTGHAPTERVRVHVPDPKAALGVGTIDEIWYTTVRDGRLESYRHKFKKRSRPILAVSADGTQFLALGGKFKFGDRGFVDQQ